MRGGVCNLRIRPKIAAIKILNFDNNTITNQYFNTFISTKAWMQ